MKESNPIEHKRFVEIQVEEMNRSKWIQSEKQHRDLGKDQNGKQSNDFFLAWIKDHSKQFRLAWDLSSCRTCQCLKCTSGPTNNCSNYINNLRIHIVSSTSTFIDFEVVDINESSIIGRYFLIISFDLKTNNIEPIIIKNGTTRRINFLQKIKNFFKRG